MSKKVTVKTLQKYKDEGKHFSMLTAYDYSTARYMDEAGIDVILVGDSVSMVILGYENTCSIGMTEMKIFTGAVARGVQNAFVLADMPFLSVDCDIPSAVQNAGELIRAGANAVKIEGYSEHLLAVVKRLVETGIPVMPHLGFTPQSLNQFGGYKVQGREENAGEILLKQAKAYENVGAFSILLEMVPQDVAKYVTENLSVPTVSCGAGKYCTGQVLVSDDVFGKYSDLSPKFVRRYGDMKSLILNCAKKYNDDVKSGSFPNDGEVF